MFSTAYIFSASKCSIVWQSVNCSLLIIYLSAIETLTFLRESGFNRVYFLRFFTNTIHDFPKVFQKALSFLGLWRIYDCLIKDVSTGEFCITYCNVPNFKKNKNDLWRYCYASILPCNYSWYLG